MTAPGRLYVPKAEVPAGKILDPRFDQIRARLAAAIEPKTGRGRHVADLVRTQAWIGAMIELGRLTGYDLLRGDIALVDRYDVPEFIHPIEGVDPVYLRRGPDVLPGRTLFVKAKDRVRFLTENAQ